MLKKIVDNALQTTVVSILQLVKAIQSSEMLEKMHAVKVKSLVNFYEEKVLARVLVTGVTTGPFTSKVPIIKCNSSRNDNKVKETSRLMKYLWTR